MIKEYKERERKKGITVYDQLTHPNNVTDREQMTLLYSDEDWIGFSEVFTSSEGSMRVFSENNIDAKSYVSKIIFTINRSDYGGSGYYNGYKRIRDFIDYLGTDYIAVGDGLHNVFDLDTGTTITILQ